jgi:hypothetical protein
LGSGFLNSGSSEGRRSRAAFKPGSARSLSRDGEGLSEGEEVDFGRGILDTKRGIPLGRDGVLGC